MEDAKRRRIAAVIRRPHERIGRGLNPLNTLVDELHLQATGVACLSLVKAIDATTPAGKLQMHILGAIAEFERARIAERVKAGLARAKAQGKRLGRPKMVVGESVLGPVRGMSVRQAALQLGVSAATAHRWLRQGNGAPRACSARGER